MLSTSSLASVVMIAKVRIYSPELGCFPVLPNAAEAKRPTILHGNCVGLFSFLPLDCHPFENPSTGMMQASTGGKHRGTSGTLHEGRGGRPAAGQDAAAPNRSAPASELPLQQTTIDRPGAATEGGKESHAPGPDHG